MLMRATGRGSISSFLKVAVDVAWVVACALLGFIWIIAAFAIYSLVTGNPTFLDLGQYRLNTPRDLTIWIAIGSILCIGVMIICAYLRGVFETLVARDPFVPENARRFAAIGIVLAVMEAAGMFVATIVSLAFGVFAPTGDGVAFRFPNINWPVWLAVLTLLVLAQVFREGAAMREEQKMTI
ncbi:MAG TPA: DUF2975 domain-containing protein [Hyphomonadaceae bacterium]|nr:DUF2975 domain-containing protein [Hyphomonadaceae bacterium]